MRMLVIVERVSQLGSQPLPKSLAEPGGTASPHPCPQSSLPPSGPLPSVLPYPGPLTGPFSPSSIVLMASKGRYISRGPWTRVLEKLGADKGLKLKGKVRVGFAPTLKGAPGAWAGTPCWGWNTCPQAQLVICRDPWAGCCLCPLHTTVTILTHEQTLGGN